MMKTNDGSIQKLQKIVATRYGKGLELRALTDVSGDSVGDGILMKGDDLHIPLRVQNAFLGTAVILEGADLETEKRSQIAQMVRMVLEPSLYRDYLERRELNLTLLNEGQSSEVDNVHRLSEVFTEESDENVDLEKPLLVSNLIYVYAHEPQRLKKAALLMHEMTERWAFVPFKDVGTELLSVSDLLKLGALTVFIESLEDLTVEKQALLLDYASVPRSSQEPLFIVGANQNPDALFKLSTLRDEFRDELSVNSLDLDRAPVTERGLREVLALMFFRAQGEA